MSPRGWVPLLLIPLMGLLAAVAARHAAALPVGGRLALASSGTLTFDAELAVRYPPTGCPAGTPGSVACFARSGGGIIRGLGTVKETYPFLVEDFPPGCAADQVRVAPATVRLTVAGKGEIELGLGGSGCLTRIPPDPVRGQETFTITSGSGTYVGASGSGTITHVSNGPSAWRGRDTWTGTLVVHGHDFDLTAPLMAGARDTTVRAPRGTKRVRVKYVVSAQDDVDGTLPVVCAPRSGSWFSIGRTRVRCSAADSSGNGSTTSFVVTVKRAR